MLNNQSKQEATTLNGDEHIYESRNPLECHCVCVCVCVCVQEALLLRIHWSASVRMASAPSPPASTPRCACWTRTPARCWESEYTHFTRVPPCPISCPALCPALCPGLCPILCPGLCPGLCPYEPQLCLWKQVHGSPEQELQDGLLPLQ